MNIFAAIGIPEVWRYDGKDLTFYLLENKQYKVSETSLALPSVESAKLLKLIEVGKKSTRKEFLLQIEEYSKELQS